MVLALLEAEDQRRLARQATMYAEDAAAVAALRAGVRLPRGRPRVGLRPRPPGDDRRRLVDPDDGREGADDADGLVRPARPTVADDGRGAVRWPRARSRRAKLAVARRATPSSAPRRCCCSASTATRLPIRASLRRIGQLIRQLEERARVRAHRPMRPRAVRVATSTATVCGCTGRSTAPASRPSLLLPTWSIVHSRALEVPGAVPRPPLPGDHVRRARLRSVGPPASRRRTATVEYRAPTPSPCSTSPGPSERCSAGSRAATVWAVELAADHPDRVLGACASGRRSPWRPMPSERKVHPFDERLDDDGGMGQVQPVPLAGRRLPRLPRVLLRPDVHRAALDEADRGLRRVGRSRSTRRRWSTIEDGLFADRRASDPVGLRAGPLPGARDPR